MERWRKKPVEIEAIRITPTTIRKAADWIGEAGQPILDPVDGECIMINTLEGQMKARHGDYVIKGVQGEFYPCKADIFVKPYDPVGR